MDVLLYKRMDDSCFVYDMDFSEFDRGQSVKIIDADKLIKDLSDLKKSPWANMPYLSADRKFGIRESLEMIESIVRCDKQTVDAVPVIRCKDCKKFVIEEDETYCEDMFGQCGENGFCAWAERREE